MRATLVGQSGSRNPILRPRRTTQRTGVIGGRPAPLLPQNGHFTSTACTFSTTCVFTCVCAFRRAVVIGVRPAPTLDQYGLLASTACTFLQRLMFITQRTVVIGARPSSLFPLNRLLASRRAYFQTCVCFTIVCSFRPPLVIRAFLVPSLHKNVFRASTACYQQPTRKFPSSNSSLSSSLWCSFVGGSCFLGL